MTEATEPVEEPTDTEQPAGELTEETSSEHDENSGLEKTGKSGSHDAENDEDAADESSSETDVSKLRSEAASWRKKFRDAETEIDTLRRELFTAKVRETGRLADASDMEFDAAALDDKDALDTAINELLESKPHLKARSFGNVGQHDRQEPAAVSLGAILRNGA